ncbi:hypothetical protein N0V87_004046 [Didymella glomerata]|uniref:Uncharacterized protein n=1 Tax=Didymella glomerata TaxID=749621 RepID=A0A9W8X122_9PLEO|nr:hypothetical protein N0V87_004046 [Didymella glomerata]
MHLHATPGLAAEVPGFAQAQLDSLARSVEARRLQLEEDINAYIARKQDELRQYESELVETLRAMEHDKDPDAASSSRRSSAASTDSRVERIEDAGPQSQSQSPSQSQSQPDEQKKQKKHGRVHKREKELYGLVTPVFLPLLDARESTSPEKKPAPAPPAPKDADSAPKHTQDAMPGDTPTKERSASDPVKQRRSSIKKKSALRTNSSATRNRKRVSLVIDDQVVLPSDMIQEPALTSPGSETTSATTSTASLDDMIDPRLTSDAPVFIEHSDAVHHSLPLSLTHQAKTSPVKSTAPPFSNPAPVTAEADHSPPTSPNVRGPTIPYAPPSYATRSFLDPPPEAMHIEDLPSIPSAAGPEPIYPDMDDVEDEFASKTVQHEDEGFQTYVGGISGSGVDDVNQVGSVGYPSSLGASYLESYMQGRPLSVRMAAAEREGDENEIRKLRSLEERRKQREAMEAKDKRKEDDDDWDVPPAKGKDGDDDDFMGSMDDF